MSVQIRLESKGGKHSSLMFCTNGVLLRKLVGGNIRNNSKGTTDEPKEFTGLDATHVIVVSLVTSLLLWKLKMDHLLINIYWGSYNQ